MLEIIEGLKLTKPVLDKTEKFMTAIFGSSAKEMGELIADKIRYKRLINQVDIFNKARIILEKNGINPRQLNLKTLVPLLEFSSLEEEELLQEKWANLIANISSSPESGLEPKLVKTLSNMSSLEAQVLDYTFELFKFERNNMFNRRNSYKWSKIKSIDEIKFNEVNLKLESIKSQFRLNDDFAKICIDNLVSLGLLKYTEPEIEIDNGYPTGKLKDIDANKDEQPVEIELDISASYVQSDDFNLTTYGNYFIGQCKISKTLHNQADRPADN